MAQTLIRNACIVTMDPKVADLDGGDILVEGDRIAAIGRNLAAPNAAVIDGNGRFAKRGGQLTFPAARLRKLQEELLASHLRMMAEGNFNYQPAPGGPLPERYVL